jgi:HD-GYP domain-containing protein (c-di-GMP phosphodiesterase class II)
MEHRKATRSFTNHIAYVFISLIIFVIIALTSVSYMITSTNITDGFINQYVPNHTELVLNKIESYIKPYISMSANMAASHYTIHWMLNENESEEGRRHYELDQKAIIRQNQLTSTFLVSLLTNTYYIQGQNEGKIDLNGKDSWMNYIINSDRDYQVNIDYRRGNNNDEIFMFINYKVKDPSDGRLIGITGTIVKIDKVMQMFFDLKLGVSGYYYAINNDGLVQMHPNKDYILKKKAGDLDANFPKLEKAGGNKYEITRYTSALDNQDYIIAAEYLPELKWTIVGKISVQESFALLNRILRISILISVIILLIALLITYYISHRFKHRIGEITNNMTKFMSYISKDIDAHNIELRRTDIPDELGNMSNEICDSAEYVLKLMSMQELLRTEIEKTSMEIIEKNKELRALSNQTIYALASAIDAKDSYTRGHSVRVAQYSRELARRMGKSELEQEEIFNVALLHDVGKIAIPDTIINKPAKLTDEEFALIKSHPVKGYEILKDISVMPNLYIGARWHHERYDGRGYPDGKAGTDIPEIARIICVADCYDAMTSDRSYRKALPQHVVRSEIENNMGTQFDPEIAAIMLIMIDEDREYMMRGMTDVQSKQQVPNAEKQVQSSRSA